MRSLVESLRGMLPRRAESTARVAAEPPRSEQVAQEFKQYFSGAKLSSPEVRVLKDEVAINAAWENFHLHPDDEVAQRRARGAYDTKNIRRKDPEYKEKAIEVERIKERLWYERRSEGASEADLSKEIILLFENTKKNVLAPQPATPTQK